MAAQSIVLWGLVLSIAIMLVAAPRPARRGGQAANGGGVAEPLVFSSV